MNHYNKQVPIYGKWWREFGLWTHNNKTEQKSKSLVPHNQNTSLDDLMIWMNLIKNNSVATEDINLAAKAFGPNDSTIKGKTTIANPAPVVSNLVEILYEYLENHQ